MANLNKVLLLGRLTRDPQLKYTSNGTPVADLSLAINRFWSGQDGKRNEETTFVDVTLWSRQAELAAEYLSKGREVFIEGRLKFDQWDTPEGQRRSKLSVVAESMQFIGPRNEGGGQQRGQQDGEATDTGSTSEYNPAPEPAKGDEIPF